MANNYHRRNSIQLSILVYCLYYFTVIVQITLAYRYSFSDPLIRSNRQLTLPPQIANVNTRKLPTISSNRHHGTKTNHHHHPHFNPTVILTENFNTLSESNKKHLNKNHFVDNVFYTDITTTNNPTQLEPDFEGFTTTTTTVPKDNGETDRNFAPNKCEFWLISNSGNITSFGDYKQNVNCIYRVTPIDSTVCQLELYFDDFDVKDIRSETNNNAQIGNIEREFAQLSSRPESCVDNYLEFNNRKRYCHQDWKNRMDIVEIDPNYEKDFVFRLVLDSKTHSNGFNIKYKPVLNTCNSVVKKYDRLKISDSSLHPVQMMVSNAYAQQCEKRFEAMEFEIKSANYPNNYSNNLDCAYYIVRQSNEVCGLELKFLHFDIEESEGCAYDFFSINSENFCGHLPNGSRNVFRFDTPVKPISFQTDSQVNAPGFHIKFRQLTNCANAFMPIENGPNNLAKKCSIVMHKPDGFINSVKYPESYPDDIICAYTIERNPGGNFCAIKITFIDFDLQQSNDCSSDYFQMENKRFCGHQLAQVERMIPFNRNGYIKFLFKSDQAGSGKGFLFNYTQLPCDETNSMLDTLESKTTDVEHQQDIVDYKEQEKCEQVYQAKKFQLISELVDGNYKANSDCKFTIKKFSPKVCYLEMYFKSFDLEASPDCQYDFMEIGNAVRLCGTLNQETSRIYVFDNPEMFILFHTDGNNERKGYLIEVEQLECEGDRIIRENYAEDDLKEGLQSLEHFKFEQQHHYVPSNESQIVLQQQENFINQASEFDTEYPKRKYAQPSSMLCSRTYQQKEFFINSPGFPADYATDLDCVYMILPFSPDVCDIEINFDSFELQPYDFEKNCLKSDFVDVDNKEQFCGKMSETQIKMYPFASNETFFIHFHSDSFRTSFDKGFRLYIRQIECTNKFKPNKSPSSSINHSGGQKHCSRIFMSSAFDLQSPLYPSAYPSNSNCDYHIVKFKSPGVNICFLEVYFVDFNLETSPNCLKDYVSFNGMKLCGSVAKDSVRLFPFYDQEFLISFYSDSFINNKGFYLKINQNPCPQSASGTDLKSSGRPESFPIKSNEDGNLFSNYQIYKTNQMCSKTLSSTYFEFESPNYPQYYLPNLNCIYTVQRRHGRYCKLELYFVDFDIEPSTNCMEDYLEIDNVKYCNSNLPNSILQLSFYEPEKRIHFRSVNFRPRKGFTVQARQVDCDTLISEQKNYLNKPSIQQQTIQSMPNSNEFYMDNNKVIFLPSLPSICEICVTEVTGQFQSYDYPNFYPPNVNCTYKITPLPDNCMVQLRFDEFDFDYSPDCSQDYLEVNGVRYCGHQLKGVSMLLLNKRKDDLMIRMVSSSRGAIVKPSFRGFRASYTQMPCMDAQKSEPVSLNQKGQPMQHETKSSIQSPSQSQFTDYNKPMINRSPMSTGQKGSMFATPTTPIQENMYCDKTFDDKIFEIKSPGYPYQYYDNLYCSYLIRKNSANVCRLKVTFNHFNLVGEDRKCKGDYLDLFNNKFCGVLDDFTTKEISFLNEKLILRFYTNDQETAEGFHLTLEQIDCADPSKESSTNAPKSKMDDQNVHMGMVDVQQQQQKKQNNEPLKYDDDETAMEFESHNKANDKLKPEIVYEPNMNDKTTEHTMIKPMPESNQSPHAMGNGYPLKYFSRNITVMDENGQPKEMPIMVQTSIMTPDQGYHHYQQQQQPQEMPEYVMINENNGMGNKYSMPNIPQQHQQPQQKEPPPQQSYENVDAKQESPMKSSKLCDQSFIEKVFFELKFADLKMSKNGADCQLHVKKARSNICQLDLMFIRYNLSDNTCSQQYLSVDGERICGHVHESTLKRFWFTKPEIFLFVKLNRIAPINDETFEIKARQMECVSNLEDHGQHKMIQQQQPMSMPMPMMNEMKPPSPSSHYQQMMVVTNDNLPTRKYPIKGQYETFGPNPNKIFSQKSNVKDFELEQKMSTMKPFTNEKDTATTTKITNEEEYNRYCDLIENEINFKIVSDANMNLNRCRYTIRKANDNVCAIDIKFEMFRLNEDIKCEHEYMEIDSGKICGAFPIGHERRYHFMPNEYEKIIYFISDDTVHPKGDFKLDVKQVEDCDQPSKQKPSLIMPTVCDISVRNYRGNIKSPNYPAPYGDFTKCVYRIQAISEEYCSVKLNIRDIDIEPDSRAMKRCDKDYLEINSQKLCGKKLDQYEFTIPLENSDRGKMAQIKFTSDAFGNGRGFDIEYRQEMCAREQPRSKSNLISPGQKGLSIESRFRTQIKPVKMDTNNHHYQPSSASPFGSPVRPNYPPNYVSKAHMLKTMDRKEFIKMMLMEDNKKIKMNISQQKEDFDTITTTTANTMTAEEITGTSIPATTTTTSSPRITTMNTESTIGFTTTNDDRMVTTETDNLITTTEASTMTISDLSM